MRKTSIVLVLLVILAGAAWANKTSVTIKGPESAAAGDEVTLTLAVSHKGNSGIHHTDWVSVKAGGVEIARWEFSRKSLPEAAEFVREVKLKVTAAVEVTAQGHCNIHGSAGPAVLKIALR